MSGAVTCPRVASCIVGNSVSVPGLFFFQWRKEYYTENNSFLTIYSTTVSGGVCLLFKFFFFLPDPMVLLD